MSTQLSLENFEKIYNNTYGNTLKYTIVHCSNMNDVNDIIQDTYVELYKNLKKDNNKEVNSAEAYIIGITSIVLKKHYRNKYKEKNNVSAFATDEDVQLTSGEDLELNFINKKNVEMLWKYLQKKDFKILQIFYLYYEFNMKIVDIANELKLNESTVKNYIYRTIKELKSVFGKECDKDARK